MELPVIGICPIAASTALIITSNSPSIEEAPGVLLLSNSIPAKVLPLNITNEDGVMELLNANILFMSAITVVESAPALTKVSATLKGRRPKLEVAYDSKVAISVDVKED